MTINKESQIRFIAVFTLFLSPIPIKYFRRKSDWESPRAAFFKNVENEMDLVCTMTLYGNSWILGHNDERCAHTSVWFEILRRQKVFLSVSQNEDDHVLCIFSAFFLDYWRV